MNRRGWNKRTVDFPLPVAPMTLLQTINGLLQIDENRVEDVRGVSNTDDPRKYNRAQTRWLSLGYPPLSTET